VKEVLTLPDRLPSWQLIDIGHVPRVVRLPTFHDQLIAPVELAVLSTSPAAVEGPDSYLTTIEHRAPADVLMDTIAVLLRGTDAVSAVTFTASFEVVGIGVGFGLGFEVGFGVTVGFLVAGTLVVDDEANAVGAGASVELNGLAWPAKPRAAGGGVGAGSAVLPPRHDPTTAARKTTTIRTPTHERMPQVVGAPAAGGAASVATGIADFRPGLESDV
jgi:hypothetical protein